MTHDTQQTKAVRKIIDELIHVATTYNINELDRIYHDDLEVSMVDVMGEVNVANKNDFKNIFKSKLDANQPPMNTWAKYHRVTVEGNTARVLLSRKNDLNGDDMDLFLTIDLVHENNTWQIHREVIFLRPDTSGLAN